MLINFIVLLITTLAAGLSVYLFPKFNQQTFKLLLVFAGSYLFSITILHILPELFATSSSPYYTGLFVLVGFLLQQSLEFLTSGVEHGHIHHSHIHDEQYSHKSSVAFLMVGLCLHSVLEGALLTQPTSLENHDHGSSTLLLGIIIHKMPAAFALATVLRIELKKKATVLLMILLFALASPIGMLGSDLFARMGLLEGKGMEILFAIVSGGFLHISTTIFFESSPHHRFQANKLLISILAALLAILSEFAF